MLSSEYERLVMIARHRRSLQTVWIVGTLLLSPVGHAAPGLPNDLRIETSARSLVVRQGGVRAPIVPFRGEFSEVHSSVAPDHGVTIRYEYHCSWTEKRTLNTTVERLRAQIANEIGLAKYHARDNPGAIEAFRSAVTQDGSYDIARFNLASTLVRMGRKDQALDALNSLVHEQSFATYLHVAGDPDLAALLETPPFELLRSDAPGTISIPKTFAREGARDLVVGVSRDRRIIALLLDHDGADEEVTHHWIELRSVVDDRVMGQFDLGTSPSEYEPRARLATATLTRLGFDKPLDLLKGEAPEDPDKQDTATRFAVLHLGVVLSGRGTVRVLRGDHVLAERPAPFDNLKAEAIPSAGALVVRFYLYDLHYPCESQDPPHVFVLRIPNIQK